MSTNIYKSELGRCFNLAFSTSHENRYNFSNEELLNLNPDHIYAYLSFKVFGTSTPLESDKHTQGTPLESDKHTQGRLNSIEYTKKAILYFMPNQLMKWDLQSNSGNSTKSVKVNEKIKRVKKAQVRREGKASAARRAMELLEFYE